MVKSAVTILTFTNLDFWPLMLNWLRHHSSIALLAMARTRVHMYDNETSVLCTREVERLGHRDHVQCVLAADQANVLDTAFNTTRWRMLKYKLQAAHAAIESQVASGDLASPVIILDADALILSAPCLLEWVSFGEDIVMQTETLVGCPTDVFKALGFGLNTGVGMFRPAAYSLLDAVLRNWRRHHFRYLEVCADQEMFSGYILRYAAPSWTDFPNTLQLNQTASPFVSTRKTFNTTSTLNASSRSLVLSLRLLNFSRWPNNAADKRIEPYKFSVDRRLEYKWLLDRSSFYRYRNRSDIVHIFYAINESERCMCHLQSGSAELKRSKFRRRNLWYLD